MMKHSVYAIALLLVSLIPLSCGQEKQQQDGANFSNAANRALSRIPSDSRKQATPDSISAGQEEPPQTEDPQKNISNGRQTAITNAVKKVSPAVVSITVTEVVQGRRRGFNEFYNRFFSVPVEREVSSMGSGFIISKNGLVVTNQHVAGKNAKKVVVSLSEGVQYDAKVLGSDELADLTLLKMKADREFPTVEFGNSDSVIVGEWSIAVGNPFGLFKSAQPSVTVGVVSARNRDFRPNPNKPRVYMDMIQTDAAINRGNSGGPLVDSEGKVIGVNTFIFTGGTSNGFVGLGFAIPSNRVQKIIRQLSASGEVQLSYDPGFSTTEMTYQMAAKYDLPAVMGLLVESVNRDGPAFEAGIVPGDIILKIGDERVQSNMHARALFREFSEGDSMRVELLRDNKRYGTKIMLRKKVKE